MRLDDLPRLRLAQLPTPLEEMARLSEFFDGPRLWVKRDDQTGLALGGNKTRKLEFLMADALTKGATTIVTGGAAQSNHCRQTAAAAARVGRRCVLVLGGEPPEQANGNLLLDRLLGAEVQWVGKDRRGERLQEVVESLREEGEQPYLIPYGGSNAIGATGYAQAMRELSEQLAAQQLRVDRILFASSSGGTHAGMVVGAAIAGITAEIHGILIDKDEAATPARERLAALARQTARHLDVELPLLPDDFTLHEAYLGEGYGIIGEAEQEAIQLVARHEGLLLDPVYTARAMGGLIDMIQRGAIGRDETILFWHTGGAPALFAYASEL